MPCRKIYVGDLPPAITKKEIEELFTQYGGVISVDFALEKNTGKRFAVVEMKEAKEESRAIAGLDGKKIQGATLLVRTGRSESRRGTDRGAIGDRRAGLGKSVGGRGSSTGRRKKDRRK